MAPYITGRDGINPGTRITRQNLSIVSAEYGFTAEQRDCNE
jgi:hypothetical protein